MNGKVEGWEKTIKFHICFLDKGRKYKYLNACLKIFELYPFYSNLLPCIAPHNYLGRRIRIVFISTLLKPFPIFL